MTVNPALLREAEAARRLGTSVRTLQKWRCNGKGPRFVRLSRAVRYDPADLDAFIAVGRRTSTSDPGAGLSGREAA
jgi:predicted DNA-binding transcriptional regulator AlpA